MPGMFGGGGMSGQDMLNLANKEAEINRTNTWSPIYGGTTWSQTDARSHQHRPSARLGV